MKYTLVFVLLLTACTPKLAEPVMPVDRVVCDGKFVEMSDTTIVVACNDGRYATYSSHRFSMTRSIVQSK